MRTTRPSSLSPIQLEGWRWAPFLEAAITRLERLQPKPYPVDTSFLHRSDSGGPAGRPFHATTQTWACSTEKLRQVRAACVEAGSAAAVLNLVMNPRAKFDLPFFGADLVTLPNGHLIALDLQPALKTDAVHTEAVWRRLTPLFERWRSELPDGGPIPEEAQPFFSPCFLWTRLPLGAEGDALITKAVYPAYLDYLDLYLDLVSRAEQVPPEREVALLDGQRAYTDYRAEKDPARGMLGRFHGRDWTELFIHGVLFDLDRPGSAHS